MKNLTASVIDLNEIRSKKAPLPSTLSNAQYFVRELVDRYAFTMKELAERIKISERTLGRFYNLETSQPTRKTSYSLLKFYCAVVYGGVHPLQIQLTRTVKVQIPDRNSMDYYFVMG